MMLDLRRLALLHQFSLRGSISATAAALGYSPSAVSQQLSALEREVGIDLIERSPRSARLTPAGELLARRIEPLLTAADELESEIDALAGDPAGAVGVAVIPSLAAQVAARVAATAAAHPRLEATVIQSETGPGLERLARGDLDVAVVDVWPGARRPTYDGLRWTEIARHDLVLAVPRHPGPLRGTRLRELVDGRTLLCAPAGHPSREFADRLLARAGAEPAARWEFEGLLTLATLVADGTGIAVLPSAMLDLVRDRVADHPLQRQRRVYAVVRASRARRPAVAEVLAACRQMVAPPPL